MTSHSELKYIMIRKLVETDTKKCFRAHLPWLYLIHEVTYFFRAIYNLNFSLKITSSNLKLSMSGLIYHKKTCDITF